ncbi:MAG TPA: hypothetical protein VF797_06130, partial [Noviherbaspirillum sp.]
MVSPVVIVIEVSFLIGSQLSGNHVITFISLIALFCPASWSQIDGFLSQSLDALPSRECRRNKKTRCKQRVSVQRQARVITRLRGWPSCARALSGSACAGGSI